MSYYHFDQLGSTRLLTNSAGAVTDEYSYDAYGAVLSHNRSTGSVDQPYQYVGQLGYYTHYQEPGFGLLQLGARFYEGKIGLFKQTDSVSDLYLSTYVYAKNRPTRVVDPDGRQALVYPKLVPSPSCGEVCGGGHAITMAQKYVEQIVDELSLGRCPPTITVNCFENRRCSHKGRVECGKSLPNSGSGASMKINFAPPCADPMCLILHELVHTCGMTAHGWYGTIRIAPCGGVGFGK